MYKYIYLYTSWHNNCFSVIELHTHFLSRLNIPDLDSSISLLVLPHYHDEGHCLLLTVLELVQQLGILFVQKLRLKIKNKLHNNNNYTLRKKT